MQHIESKLLFKTGSACDDPGRSPDGQQFATSYETGSLVYYNCTEAGYELSHPYPLFCEVQGDHVGWNNSHPFCTGKFNIHFVQPSQGVDPIICISVGRRRRRTNIN